MNTQHISSHSKPFIALLITQLLGAANDNLFKTTVSLIVLKSVMLDGGGIFYLSLTAALFILPYILFSGFAGYLSDRYSKSRIIQGMKALEVLIMIFAALSFSLGNNWLLIIIVFLMGMQSALLSPAKYSILPEILAPSDLSKGNGYLELVTFSGIIIGTAATGLLFLTDLNPGLFNVLVAVAGLSCSFFIPYTVAEDKAAFFSLSPVAPHRKYLAEIFAHRGLSLTVIGLTLFWFLGALFQLNILLFAEQALQLGETKTSLLLALLGVGIGTGSVVAGKASEGKVELGLVPLGALGMTVLCVLLGVLPLQFYLAGFLILGLGVSGGFFSVPILAYLQANSPAENRGGYIAASNFLSFVGMFFSSVLFWFLSELLGLSSQVVFAFMGIVTLTVSLYLIRLMPVMLLRAINWLALHTFYRITVRGAENVPLDSGVLLVSNHVSFVDAQLILAAIPRNVHFVMYRPIYQHPLVHPFARTMGALPIAGSDGKERIAATLAEASALINEGRAVGIFAEGKVTQTGEINEFRPGLETIMANQAAPIIPVYIAQMWGSMFSRKRRRFKFLPSKIPYPIHICFGEPLPAHTSAAEVEAVVRRLAVEYGG
jgi:acyl-[acyl-carrier-protein]-phospholipid O-acyltransferase/long-chain-fatty-acid--[acyl-carrier-protein] ligase